MRSSRYLLAALAIGCLFASEARANNEISLRLSSLSTVDRGVDAFSTSRQLLSAELSYARALTHPQRGLWVEAAWMISGSKDPLFGTQLTAQGTFHTFSLGARFTWPLWSWLVPQARAGVGLIVGRVIVDGDGGVGQPVSDTAYGLAVYALAGVQFLLPRRWMRREDQSGFTVGFVIEGGILATTAMAFTLAPKADEELRQIPLTGVDVGDVSLTAGVFRAGLLVRF